MIKPKIFQIFPPFCVQNYSKNYSPEFSPQENCPLWKSPHGEITPNEIPSPFINHTNERKNKITKCVCLEESCAIQYPYQNNQGPFWYIDDTENTELRYFLYIIKKIQKSTESKNRRVAFTCQLYKSTRTKTRQSNYKIWQNVKVLNSQLSLHSTLWILKQRHFLGLIFLGAIFKREIFRGRNFQRGELS